jgi:TolA-binding protein
VNRRVAAASLLILAAACRSAVAPAPAGESGGHPAAVLDIPPLGADAGGPPIAADPVVAVIELPSLLAIPARDPRIAGRRPRSRAHVLSEAQAAERTLAALPAGDPSRVPVLRRAAEAHNELAMTSSGPDAARARAESIKHYAELKDLVTNAGSGMNGPPVAASYPEIDEVLYYLGLAYELTGDAKKARVSYYELLSRHPTSKLVPLAYFAFGELFFMEARADPAKNELAEQAYRKVLESPPADNPLFADALLRSGEVQQRLREPARAKDFFDRLRREFPDSAAAAQIGTRRAPP